MQAYCCEKRVESFWNHGSLLPHPAKNPKHQKKFFFLKNYLSNITGYLFVKKCKKKDGIRKMKERKRKVKQKNERRKKEVEKWKKKEKGSGEWKMKELKRIEENERRKKEKKNNERREKEKWN